MVMISNVNTFIPREWKDTSLSLFSLLYFSCELAVLIIMLGDFSVLRDFHDGFNFVTRKANIVDKNSKKKKKRPTDSHKRPDTKLHVKTHDIGASLTRATINLRYDTTSILKEALKQLRLFSEQADEQTSHAELLWDMRTLAIISVFTTLITFTINTGMSFI